MTTIKIRSIEKNPAYETDQSMTEFLVEIEIEKNKERTVETISVVALDDQSFNTMLPNILLDHMIQKQSKALIESLSPTKREFIFNETNRTLT